MRVAASNGVKPQYRALSAMKLNVPFTAADVGRAVDPEGKHPAGHFDKYTPKYLTFLRRDGFEFASTRVGKAIVSYTLIKEPANAESFRNLVPKVKAPVKPKAEKTVKPKAEKTVKPKDVEAEAALATLQESDTEKSLKHLEKMKEETKKAVDPNVERFLAFRKAAAEKKSKPERKTNFNRKVKVKENPASDSFESTQEFGAIDAGWDALPDDVNLRDII